MHLKRNERTPDILNSSATLLGLCFVVLTARSVFPDSQVNLIDYFTGAAILGFMSSCVLAFLSMRSGDKITTYENIADYVFLGGLFFLFSATLVIVFDVL